MMVSMFSAEPDLYRKGKAWTPNWCKNPVHMSVFSGRLRTKANLGLRWDCHGNHTQ
jgi:hypothetical protein